MMNSGGLKTIAITVIIIGCLAAITLGADLLPTFAIGFLGVWGIDELV